jgi:hypothetical protein
MAPGDMTTLEWWVVWLTLSNKKEGEGGSNVFLAWRDDPKSCLIGLVGVAKHPGYPQAGGWPS